MLSCIALNLYFAPSHLFLPKHHSFLYASTNICVTMELTIPGNQSSGELNWQKQLVSQRFSHQAESLQVPAKGEKCAGCGRQEAVKPLSPSAYAPTECETTNSDFMAWVVFSYWWKCWLCLRFQGNCKGRFNFVSNVLHLLKNFKGPSPLLSHLNTASSNVQHNCMKNKFRELL